jgi:DNA mismatch repair protein MutS2
MLYPKDIENKLGFAKIREWLKKRCSGAQGVRNVDKIRFSSDVQLIRKLCRQTEAFMHLNAAGGPYPSLQYPEIALILKKAHIKGSFLEPQELVDVQRLMTLASEWYGFISKHAETYDAIADFGHGLQVDTKLIKSIEACIDEKGGLKENASPTLRKIRQKIRTSEQQARKVLDRVIREARKSDMMPEDNSLTIRNGRLVMPIKAEFKRTVKGFVHDTSASGNILFVEPTEVLETNNALRELAMAEQREIINILTMLTDIVRDEQDNLKDSHRILGILDLIKAKAAFAHEFDAIVPEINSSGSLRWIAASNPVLKQALEKQEKQLVPLTVELCKKDRILLISGPNAGGKSVCLQTLGLLQYMVQCGLPVPVMEGSTTIIFKDIFVDIGDEQSIEDDLSTYSSHLKSMNHFLSFASRDSLLLIDEFGSGTDPQFGGAIAEAVLEQFADQKVMGAVTTHYNNLKKLGGVFPGLVNGRMRFDVQKLEPFYQLEMGKPGSSFALEIAGKIGLPKKVIGQARRKVGTDTIELDQLLNDLEKEKRLLEDRNKRFQANNSQLEKTLADYRDVKEEIERRRKEIINQAKSEAREILKQTNKKVENLIREIKENKAAREATRELRLELKDYDRKLKTEPLLPKKEKIRKIGGNIATGDMVRIEGQESVGEVINISKKDAVVVFGDLQTKVKTTRLERVAAKSNREASTRTSNTGINLVQRRADFTHELDIRGKRAEEALGIVDSYIDDAILLAVPTVRIIHGKGNGILRHLIREMLLGNKQVAGYRDEHSDRGGAGITVVDFG